MAGVGLSGRAFIPLLSSFACAIPGIMATRTIDDPKDRLTTILIAPLMTCSARLPVYAVIIGAFIPARTRRPGHRAAGAGAVRPLCRRASSARWWRRWCCGRTIAKGASGGFMMELPQYQMPRLARLADRAVAARLDLPAPRRHDHHGRHGRPVAAALLPAGARRGQKPGANIRSPGASPTGLDGRAQADRLQPRDGARDDPGDGGARGRGVGARHRLFDRRRATTETGARRWSAGLRRAGRCRPRSPSSPGSCSRRNASRPSR